jgi:hypothetical protein
MRSDLLGGGNGNLTKVPIHPLYAAVARDHLLFLNMLHVNIVDMVNIEKHRIIFAG